MTTTCAQRRASPSEGEKGAIPQPVFVVGVPRSGTTLLAALLSAHSDVVGIPETHFFPQLVHGGTYVRRPARRRFSRSCESSAQASVLSPEKTRTAFEARLRERPVPANTRFVVENTPANLEHVPVIRALYPGAWVVVIVRDPRAVFCSLKKVPWFGGGLPQFCARWRHYSRLGLQCRSADPSRTLLLSYETLVRDPESEIEEVQKFLGLNIEAVRDAHRGTSDQLFCAGREPWKSDVSQPVDGSKADAWRDWLSSREIARIEALLGSDLHALGFEPVSSGESGGWRDKALMARARVHLNIRRAMILGLASWYRFARALTPAGKA